MKNQLLGAGPGRRRLRAGRRPQDRRRPRWPGSAARWPRMEDSLIALERRGISLRTHALRQDPDDAQAADLSRVPRQPGALVHHAATSSTPSSPRSEDGQGARRSTTGRRRRRGRRHRRPAEPPAAPKTATATAPTLASSSCTSSSCTKCVRSTRMLADLAKMGFDIQSLIPQERTGTEEPRYIAPPRRERDRPGRSARPAGRPSGPPAKRG